MPLLKWSTPAWIQKVFKKPNFLKAFVSPYQNFTESLNMPEKKFYEEGLRFECQGSGKCCTSHGEFGHVFLTLEDRKRFAKVLNMRAGEFTKKYCDQLGPVWKLREEAGNPDCIFLKDKRCSVYEGRPTQCRTWPFWPDVMNAKSWKTEVASFCPGVGKGKLWSKEEIEKTMAAETASEKSLGT